MYCQFSILTSDGQKFPYELPELPPKRYSACAERSLVDGKVGLACAEAFSANGKRRLSVDKRGSGIGDRGSADGKRGSGIGDRIAD